MAEGKVNVIVQNQEGRTPTDSLDYQMMIVDGRWGDKTINSELYDRLQTTRFIRLKAGSKTIDENGVETIIEKDTLLPTSAFLWGELSFFTRDFRLGNLTDEDFEEAKHYTLIAADCLRLNMNKAFTVALSRVASILELSQSRKGFLRNILGTKQTSETRREILETPSLILPKKQR